MQHPSPRQPKLRQPVFTPLQPHLSQPHQALPPPARLGLRRQALASLVGLSLLSGLAGCKQSGHRFESVAQVQARDRRASPDAPAAEVSSSLAAFLAKAQEPGPLRLKKFVAADWAVPRGGMINLDHERAQAVQLEDRPEPIHIYFYELEHPSSGTYLVDSGVARSFKLRADDMPVKWPVTSVMPMDELHVHLDTKSYLESRSSPLAGVFLTHLHLDHIMGLQDIPKEVPLFVGPGETKDRRFTHLLVRPTTKANLKGFGPLKQWETHTDSRTSLATLDLFGDQSALGIHVPGHTKGSMAFLLRTTEGPQLITGDSCHTAWGWENHVEPGSFNTDTEAAARSLAALQAIAADIPQLRIHLGHQEHSGSPLVNTSEVPQTDKTARHSESAQNATH